MCPDVTGVDDGATKGEVEMEEDADGWLGAVGEDSEVVVLVVDDLAVVENEANLVEIGLKSCMPLGRSHEREAIRLDTNRPEDEEDMNGTSIDALNIENKPAASRVFIQR